MEHIGLDVHKQSSQFCILTEDKELLELRIRMEHGRFVELLGKRPKAKVLIEASTESEWVARLIEQLGHEEILCLLTINSPLLEFQGFKRTINIAVRPRLGVDTHSRPYLSPVATHSCVRVTKKTIHYSLDPPDCK